MEHTDLSQEVKQQIAALILIPNNKITLDFQAIGSKTTGFYNTASMIYTIAFAASISFQQVQLSMRVIIRSALFELSH